MPSTPTTPCFCSRVSRRTRTWKVCRKAIPKTMRCQTYAKYGRSAECQKTTAPIPASTSWASKWQVACPLNASCRRPISRATTREGSVPLLERNWLLRSATRAIRRGWKTSSLVCERIMQESLIKSKLTLHRGQSSCKPKGRWGRRTFPKFLRK